MSKAYVVIEQIDNGFLVDAADTHDDGTQESARFAVATGEELISVLMAALLPKPSSPLDNLSIEESEEVIWPDDPPETIN